MQFHLAPYLAQSIGGVAFLGCIIGGSAAAAKFIRLITQGTISLEDGLHEVGIETGGAGFATLIGASSAEFVGGGFGISVFTALVTGTAGKYAWDHLVAMYNKRREKPSAEDDEFEL